MTRLRRIFGAWVALLSTRETGESLAAFRIAVGVVALSALLGIVTPGLLPVLLIDRRYGGFRNLGRGPLLIQILGGPTPAVVWTVTIATVVLCVFLIAGLGGRLTAFLALQGYIAIHRLAADASGGSDVLVTNALWLLVLSRSTITLSFDAKLKTGRFLSDEAVNAFPRYLAIFQLVVVYWTTGMQKVSAYWTPVGSYSALYYILQEPTWQRFDMTFTAYVFPLTQIATAVTWIWEVTTPLLLLALYFRYTAERGGRLRRWFNRWDLRKPWAIVGISLHLMILVFLDVGHFSQISLAFYACIVRPEELRAAAAWARRRLSPGDARASVPAVSHAPE